METVNDWSNYTNTNWNIQDIPPYSPGYCVSQFMKGTFWRFLNIYNIIEY